MNTSLGMPEDDQGVARFPPPDHRPIPQVQDLDTVIAPGAARTSWGRLACQNVDAAHHAQDQRLASVSRIRSCSISTPNSGAFALTMPAVRMAS